MPKQIGLLEAMRELEADAANPKARPAWANGLLTTIPLRQLSKRTAVFQPRSLEGNHDDDEDFTRGLVRALKDADGEALDAVTVWWSGRRFYVIDGHHRFEAYKRHFAGKPVNIPCEEFEGTLFEAMEFAGQANHKNKLPMSQDDRLNYAWRLVCTADRTAAAESIRQRKAKLDPNRVCSVPGCANHVGPESIGSLCVKHVWRCREAGHPWHPMPLGKERKAARQAVVRYLDQASNGIGAASFLAYMARAVDRLREPLSNALTPLKIRREAPTLTTKGKAQIVWAWLSKRDDFERLARRMLIEAMTLEVWAACYYHGQKRDLPKLLNTTVGRTAVWFACKGGLKETKTRTVAKWITRSCYPASEGPTQKVYVDETTTDKWRPSNYVRVAVGRRVFLALREILPANWVTDPMVCETLNEIQTKGEPRIAA